MHANFKDFRKRSSYYVPGVSLVKTRQKMCVVCGNNFNDGQRLVTRCQEKLSTKVSKSTSFNSITNNLILKQCLLEGLETMLRFYFVIISFQVLLSKNTHPHKIKTTCSYYGVGATPTLPLYWFYGRLSNNLPWRIILNK